MTEKCNNNIVLLVNNHVRIVFLEGGRKWGLFKKGPRAILVSKTNLNPPKWLLLFLEILFFLASFLSLPSAVKGIWVSFTDKQQLRSCCDIVQ